VKKIHIEQKEQKSLLKVDKNFDKFKEFKYDIERKTFQNCIHISIKPKGFISKGKHFFPFILSFHNFSQT